MLKSIQLFICISGIIAGNIQLTAQDAMPLTIQDAVTAALANHPALQAAQADINTASADLRGIRSVRNPEILISPTIFGSAKADSIISITQPIDINGMKKARMKIATEQINALNAEYIITKRDLILKVKTAYWKLAQALAMVAFDIENLKYAETIVNAAKKQVELGNEPKIHITKTEVELGRARQQLMRSQSAATQAQATINIIMGHNPVTTIIPADNLNFTSVILNDEKLIRQAITNRPEVIRDNALEMAATGEIDVICATYRPNLSIQICRESWSGNNGIGLSLSLPIIDWGSRRAEYERANAVIAAQKHHQAVTRLTIELEINNAITNAKSAEDQIVTIRDQVLKPAESLAQLTTTGYQEGAMNYLEVLEAQRTLRIANAEYLTALSEYHIALAQVEWASGANITQIASKEIIQ